MKRWSGRVTALAGVVVALGVTACASSTGGVAGRVGASDTSTPTAPAAPHCPTTPTLPGPHSQPVPAGFRTAWVLRCQDETRPVAGNGVWWFRIEEHADTNAAALVAALRKPDLATPPETVCPASANSIGYVALVDAAGNALFPRPPVALCGQPQPAVLAALKALPFHEVRATRLHQEQSQASIDTGCGQMWTDVLTDDLLAYDNRPAAPRHMWPKPPDALRICLWQLQPGGYPRLVSAHTVTGADLATLLAALDRLAAAQPCTARHSRFVVVEYIHKDWWDSAAYGEVDGCQRIQRPDHTLGQLDDATVRLLSTSSDR